MPINESKRPVNESGCRIRAKRIAMVSPHGNETRPIKVMHLAVYGSNVRLCSATRFVPHPVHTSCPAPTRNSLILRSCPAHVSAPLSFIAGIRPPWAAANSCSNNKKLGHLSPTPATLLHPHLPIKTPTNQRNWATVSTWYLQFGIDEARRLDHQLRKGFIQECLIRI